MQTASHSVPPGLFLREASVPSSSVKERNLRLSGPVRWLALSLFAFPVCLAQTAATRMIESVLPGVITITVERGSPASTVFGAAGSSASFSAYARVLDLSGAESSGSGFIISRDGKLYVVTNAHVIQSAVGDSVFAYSVNQTKYKLMLVGADSFYDIAVLQFSDTPGKEVHAIPLRSTEPQIGEPVYAIGNPLGRYPYSVTSGIVGGKNRIMLGLTGRFGFVQSSATVSWGNSGGPLIDETGAVLGINTQIEISQRFGQYFQHPQLNFALQSTYATRLVNEILSNHGRVRRAYLGMSVGQLVRVQGERSDVVGKPLLVRLAPGSPAGKLAPYVGWRIDAVDGRDIENLDDLLFAFEQCKPQQRVAIELSPENGRPVKVEIEAGELTPDNLIKLSLSFLQTEFHVTPREHGDSLTAEVGEQPPERGMAELASLVVAEEGDRMVTRRAPMQPIFPIVGAGLLADKSLYRVRNLQDLAIVVKLVAPTGRIDLFVPSERDGEMAMVSGQLRAGNAIRRTVLY